MMSMQEAIKLFKEGEKKGKNAEKSVRPYPTEAQKRAIVECINAKLALCDDWNKGQNAFKSLLNEAKEQTQKIRVLADEVLALPLNAQAREKINEIKQRLG
ncbi:hypothetical protein [Campylobacter gastrosuis]|uniref:Uncharacterized protein n=1 Tax=Campylobacter gastrosuis TaxID=2974576 RepID=A0ABT7HTE4_9BACT|nr:hypothetical protein [Campylobacter gastrosuis]MDL0090073.1 hypothetical protein [Campylobacter gastrosuis]